MSHTPTALKEVMDKENLQWRTFADDGTIAKKWNSPPTPTFYVLDAQGVIRHKWFGHPGEDKIDSVVEALVKKAKQ